MTKFKVGDKVRLIEEDHYANIKYPVGTEMILEWVSQSGTVLKGTINGNIAKLWSNKCELVNSQYPKLILKPGDKLKVIKRPFSWKNIDRELDEYDIGEMVTLIEVDRDGDGNFIRKYSIVHKDCLTYEYFQPEGTYTAVEPITLNNTNVVDLINQAREAVDPYHIWASRMYGESVLKPGSVIKMMGADFAAEPIKKTNIIQKTMNVFKKAMLPASTKKFIEAGFIDESSLKPTSEGMQALYFILWNDNEAKLIEAADQEIADRKARRLEE